MNLIYLLAGPFNEISYIRLFLKQDMLNYVNLKFQRLQFSKNYDYIHSLNNYMDL